MVKNNDTVPHFDWQGQKIVAGTRVRVESRHGTKGNGTVTRVLQWANVPDTICVEMDADTEYAPESETQRGWPTDQKRIAELGLFGGEIEEILKKN